LIAAVAWYFGIAASLEQISVAQQQAQDLIITLKEIIEDMQAGDANITAFQTLITNLS
jgi:hypothetical protein